MINNRSVKYSTSIKGKIKWEPSAANGGPWQRTKCFFRRFINIGRVEIWWLMLLIARMWLDSRYQRSRESTRESDSQIRVGFDSLWNNVDLHKQNFKLGLKVQRAYVKNEEQNKRIFYFFSEKISPDRLTHFCILKWL